MNTEKPIILVVDDQLINLRIAAQVLKTDYSVLIAEDSEKAIQITREKHPDLILLDIEMPGISGLEVARIITNDPETCDIPIIFLTANSQPENIIEAIKSGGIDYVKKPFQQLELIQRINIHLQLSQQKKKLLQNSSDLKQLNEEKNKLFSVLAHDLRNFVGGSLDLMKLTLSKMEDYNISTIEDRIKIVVDNLERTTSLLNELLSWSRKQTHSLNFKPEYFLLSPEVRKNFSNYEPLANEKNITLLNEVSEGFQICGDKNMINTVLRNLIHNAIKYTGKNGSITIKAFTEDYFSYVSVIDTGIGIPEQDIDLIFEDSFHSTADTLGKTGTAVGLKICREYIKKHRGIIFAKNIPEGGCKLEFIIPVKPFSN